MAGKILGRKDVNIKTLTQPLPKGKNEVILGETDAQSENRGTLIPIRVILRDFAAWNSAPVGPADLADASIAALKSKLPANQANVQGSGAIAQGDHAKAAGERAMMAEGY